MSTSLRLEVPQSGQEVEELRKAMSHMWDLCAPAQKSKANASVWGDGKEGVAVSPLSLNPVSPGKEMLITSL